jgi:hypothetical protein
MNALLERLRNTAKHTEDKPRIEFKPAPKTSYDLDRILSLDRRAPVQLDGDRGAALVELITDRYRKTRTTPCACKHGCVDRLKPAQAWALYEAPISGGLLAPIGVGHGKTILDLLMPLAMRAKLAVLLLPPNLVAQLVNEYQRLREHFHVPSLITDGWSNVVSGAPILHVVPFSRFSRAGSTTLLESYMPDLIIVDEAHKLKDRNTATTSRVLRYLAQFPDTRLCCWSGTLTSKSIKDYSHLAAFALKEGSPLPLDPATVDEWSAVLDPCDLPAKPGPLSALCEPYETIQNAYYRRLVDTRGVIATKAGAIDAEIEIHEREAPPIPEALQTHIETLRSAWMRPDGEELVELLQVAQCARQLACGFYYRWKFPRGESRELIEEWFKARKEWHKELREKLKHRSDHLDSPLLCAQAAARAYQEPAYHGDKPVWYAATWQAWIKIKDKVQPESEAVWVDDYLAKDAASWALKNRGVVWYEHHAFGERVAKIAKLPLHAGGADAEALILAEKGDRSIVASLKAHGTGRDGLQRLFHQQLISFPPSDGAAFEQLLGRLHRIGQREDVVYAHLYRHTKEMRDAIDTALMRSRYIQGTMGTAMKVLSAKTLFKDEEENVF